MARSKKNEKKWSKKEKKMKIFVRMWGEEFPRVVKNYVDIHGDFLECQRDEMPSIVQEASTISFIAGEVEKCPVLVAFSNVGS